MIMLFICGQSVEDDGQMPKILYLPGLKKDIGHKSLYSQPPFFPYLVACDSICNLKPDPSSLHRPPELIGMGISAKHYGGHLFVCLFVYFISTQSGVRLR